MSQNKQQSVMRPLVLCAVLLAVLSVPGVARAGATKHCYTATLNSTIVMPDGSEHAPGQLKLCDDPLAHQVSDMAMRYGYEGME